ncbi:MAG: hypothetical protein K0Q57_1127, partial [Gammaproteobacteria bacterium]|nr:hypothetical protein [Gammaproteobacteria bacterium]
MHTSFKSLKQTLPDLKTPTVSIYGHPPHDMRNMLLSPRDYETVCGTVRMNQAMLNPSIHPTMLASAIQYAKASAAKKDKRILDYQSSGIRAIEYSGMTHAAVENRAYFLCRPANPEVANARLLCMLLGADVITKAMGVYQKSSKLPFSGGFLSVNADKVDEEKLASLAEKYPTLNRSVTSLRALEKAGDFYNIKLDVPLSFIFSLHAQDRIKAPLVEKDGSGNVYLKVESNDKAGVIKWRCKLSTPLDKYESKPVEASDLYNKIPDWYLPLYHDGLEKRPEAKDFKDRMSYVEALRIFEQKLETDAILASWRERLTRVPDWFIELQKKHSDISLKWDIDQLYNVTEYKDGEYRDIIILGRTVNGRNIPLVSDYDLFAVIPDQNMTDDEIWALQQKAEVLPIQQIKILCRRDGVKINHENLSEVLLPDGKLNLEKCFIDREVYFKMLAELGPLPNPGHNIDDNDLRVRYKHNTITGYGTYAEGDLTAIFNHRSGDFFDAYEERRKAAVAKLSNREAGAPATPFDENKEFKAVHALSAHHGPETTNPKPEPLPWDVEVSLMQGVFVCDLQGDFCLVRSQEDFIVLSKSIVEANSLYGTKHCIPLNANWPQGFIDKVIAASGQENIILFNGAEFKRGLEQARAFHRVDRIGRIGKGQEVTPEKSLTGIQEGDESGDEEAVTLATARTLDLMPEDVVPLVANHTTSLPPVASQAYVFKREEPTRESIAKLRAEARAQVEQALELTGKPAVLNKRPNRLAPLSFTSLSVSASRSISSLSQATP